MARLRPLIVPAVFTLMMGAILIGLGIWQLQRLAWKTAILERIEARTTAPAQPLPTMTTWASLSPDDYEYRHVALDGTFDHTKEALVFRGTAAGPGYFVLTPLHLATGGTVIVNRGHVPTDRAGPATRKAGEVAGPVHVVGLMREPEPRNTFTPADDPASGHYFTRDPALIAAHFGLSDAAPFSIDADATPVPGGLPRGGTTEIAIPNNHFSYALTWFGLAAGLFGVFGVLAWRKLRGPDEDRPLNPSQPSRIQV
ncbi:SURF1 family protein [Beijerinckia sp. L45]|uniref:SURF1 family protein n=1 Tax=Beijerinckia sp. L45 TaxID=1641855 RepID=UPI00131CD233|nr:SURF1 family protein [Beijerinckia sp. L45]